MLKLVRWLFGYITFCFSDGFGEDFLNACYQNGYNIQKIRRRDGALLATCPVGLYPLLEETAQKNGGRLTVIKRRGLYFYLQKVRNRWGIFAGLLAGVLLISFLSGFIWNIEVVGNQRLKSEDILAFLSRNGFHEGVSARSTDYDRLENLLLASFDDIAWAHINRDGTNARVEIGEGVLPPPTVNHKKYYNVKAKKDGVLVKITVYDGWVAAQKGEAVVKGDLLISGVYTGERGANLFTHARGEVLAQVKEPLSFTVNRQQVYKSYIAVREYQSLYLFGLRIPLYFGSSRAERCDESEHTDYLTLHSKRLPLGMITKTQREYVLETKTVSDKELTALTEKELDKKLKEEFADREVIKKKLDIKLNADTARVKGYVLCLENIAEEVPIKKKKSG